MLAVSICFGHNYLWNASYPGNVTESKGGGGGGVWGGRVTLIGREFLTKETAISSHSNTRQSRRHNSLYVLIITKEKKGNKVLVTVKSFSPVYLSILISSRVLILIGENR